MSLESWRLEYYPVPATHVPVAEAVAHSLLKWQGLRPDNLSRHNMEVDSFGNLAYMGDLDVKDYFPVDGRSCALCVHHIAAISSCTRCPITLAIGRPCDAREDLEDASTPWSSWTQDGDPEPMIAALEKAAGYEAANPVL